MIQGCLNGSARDGLPVCRQEFFEGLWRVVEIPMFTAGQVMRLVRSLWDSASAYPLFGLVAVSTP
jgi:hypothetical protein